MPDNATVRTDPDRGALQSLSIPDLMALAIEQERTLGSRADWPRPAWYAYEELRYRGTSEAFDAAKSALEASDPIIRIVGADVVGQLGSRQGGTFVDESVDALVSAARTESDPTVLGSVAFALGHRGSPGGRQTLLMLARHAAAEVRCAVATGLYAVANKNEEGNDADPEVVAAYLELMGDPDDEVCNWATFGLGTQMSADSPAVRAALRGRLDDPHDETREEAVCGLAKRRDEIAFQPLMEYLQSGLTGTGCIQAAEAWGDARFIEVLQTIRETQPDVSATAEAAILASRESGRAPT
jgi:HEAT repeat protein